MSTRLDESSEGRKVRLKYVKWQKKYQNWKALLVSHDL
jgi:hypothetical protein